jgi:ankyrin repeat protein
MGYTPKEGFKGNQTKKESEFEEETKQSMDWFYNLDTQSQNNAIDFLNQAVAHYHCFNKDVIMDMKAKFDLTSHQVKQLREFVYLEKIPESDEKLIAKILKNTYTKAEDNIKIQESDEKLIAKILTNIYTKAENNLRIPDECIVCYDRFPVSLRFPCGHELCVLCTEKILNVQDNIKCPICRHLLPDFFKDYQIMIYPIQLTPNIPLEQLQHAFPFICSVDNLSIVTKCIDMGVDVNALGLFMYSPLVTSAQNGHLAIIQYLVNHGANINQCHDDGKTALLISCRDGYLPVVQYLVKNGAHVNQSDNDGVTPLFLSSVNGHFQVVQYLVEHGANINQPDKNGATPLFMSSQNGHFLIVKFLVDNEADVNQADKYGATPLLTSCQGNHLKVVKYLVQNGGDIDKANDFGVTPLTVAIYKNQIEVAKFLLTKHANIESTKLFFMINGFLGKIDILDELCKEIQE